MISASKLLFAALCVLSMPTFAGMTISGKFDFTRSSSFMDMSITETGVVNGVDSLFGHALDNKGTCFLSRCTAKKTVSSYRVLGADSSQFLGDLYIGAGSASLISCQLMNLYILDAQDAESEDPIFVHLAEGTVIHGNIVFEAGLGKVYKSHDVIIEGEILGGSLLDLE